MWRFFSNCRTALAIYVTSSIEIKTFKWEQKLNYLEGARVKKVMEKTGNDQDNEKIKGEI